jgi:hypothetical protein
MVMFTDGESVNDGARVPAVVSVEGSAGSQVAVRTASFASTLRFDPVVRVSPGTGGPYVPDGGIDDKSGDGFSTRSAALGGLLVAVLVLLCLVVVAILYMGGVWGWAWRHTPWGTRRSTTTQSSVELARGHPNPYLGVPVDPSGVRWT